MVVYLQLAAWRKMESGMCGLRGTVHVSNIVSTAADDKSVKCHGSMSDWNSALCRGHSQLWISLAGPCTSKLPRHHSVGNSSSAVLRQGEHLR